MTRLRLITLLALATAFALIAAGCGDDKSASSNVPPDQRVKTALQNASKIQSGTVSIDASLGGMGMPGKMKFTGGGDFDTKAEGGPAMELSMKLDLGFGGEPQEVGLVSVDGKTYVGFAGKFYAADKMLSGITGATGSSEADTAIDSKELQELIDSLDEYVGDAEAAGTQKVGDDEVDVYRATIDVSKVVKDAKKEGGDTFEGLSRLGGVENLDKSIGETTVEIGVDADDLPRSIKFSTSIGATAAGGTGATSGTQGSIEASLLLTEVNNDVTIEKPSKIEEGSGLFEALGSMFGGMGGMGSGGLGQ